MVECSGPDTISALEMGMTLELFGKLAADDDALTTFADGHLLTTHYVLRDTGQQFYSDFSDGGVVAGVGLPDGSVEVRIEADVAAFDGMVSGRVNALKAALRGKLQFSGDAKLAMSVQQKRG